MQITISEGTSRTSTKWRSRQYEWEDFTAKIAEPTRTTETLQQYQLMSRDDKSTVKDVGGFVGGPLIEGRRKKGNVQWRGVVTLDADNAEMSLLDKFEKLGIAGAIYSTHSHTLEKPKLRIVIPLLGTVMPEEYPAIVNWFAKKLGIEQFDPTCDEPERLMYWPSCSSDADYVYRVYEGGNFDPNAFLAANPEWRDISMWELSAQKHNARALGNKAQDPLTKTGLVGAFCQVYNIHDVIAEYLSDVYEPTMDGRYTYIPGSASNGVVTYEDLWAYSHHATDPAGQKLCNAWDLLRIHRYDSDDTAMREFASKIPEVQQQMAVLTFADRISASVQEDIDMDWVKRMEMNNRGEAVQSMANVVLVLSNDTRISNYIKYDVLTDRIWSSPKLPWRGGVDMSWSEQDMASLQLFLEIEWTLNRPNVIMAGLMAFLMQHRYNPVQDYLEHLKWDGTPRLATMLVDYLGAEDSDYTRAVTTTWMTGAVARMMQPGVQFDYMMILVGKQGLGKSAFLRKLCGVDWFTESVNDLSGSKTSAEGIRGKWIINIDELSALKKQGVEQEQIKNFLTRTVDSYRPAYGRFVVDIPRVCVFSGTSNREDFLRDYTGGRRYWPVVCTRPPVEVWGHGDFPKDQLWAEARVYYEMDMPLFLDEKLTQQAMQMQEHFTDTHDMVGMFDDFINTPIPLNFYDLTIDQRRDWFIAPDPNVPTMLRETICKYEVWCEMMGQSHGNFGKKNQYEISTIFSQSKLLNGTKRVRVTRYGLQRSSLISR